MKKADLVAAALAGTGLSREEAREIVQQLLDRMADAIVTEGRIEFRGFGVFTVRERGAHPARHPRTGRAIMVPARRTVIFKPSRRMSRRLNRRRAK